MFFVSILIIAASIGVDQLIKYLITANFELGQTKSLIPNILSLTHIRNSGAAWSIMEGKTWFLVGLPIIVMAAALVFMYKKRGGSKLMLSSLALIIGGGIGNLIDRIRLHEVVDYLKTDFINFPIFNFADICVVCGAVMFCVYMVFFDESDKKSDEKSEDKNG